MSRPLRLEFPGALYHVTARGNAGQAIFADDRDRHRFLAVLAGEVERLGWLCHAYCLMGNHYHLVVETPSAGLGRGLRQLNGIYTQGFNRRHGRVGHVFQGRYKALLVERESYLLVLARYVVLNPVAARLVRHPADWVWSSYFATAGLARPPGWLAVGWLRGQFGQGAAACDAYRRFVEDEASRLVEAGAVKGGVWQGLKRQLFLGSDDFVARLTDRAGAKPPSAEVPRRQRVAARPIEAYRDAGGPRDVAMAATWASGAYTQVEIARVFGVHYSTVSRVLRRSGTGRDDR